MLGSAPLEMLPPQLPVPEDGALPLPEPLVEDPEPEFPLEPEGTDGEPPFSGPPPLHELDPPFILIKSSPVISSA